MEKMIAMAMMLLVIITALLYFIRPPGNPLKEEQKHVETSRTKPLMLSQGRLPGVTWIDDIHPIFVKNKCKHCHTRGREAIAEGFKDLALGIIDPNDENNAYYSYHELVYAQGPPQIQKGEKLRDGQCCRPHNYPFKKQRRIWIGYPERSVLIRKLDYDYYDWDMPPRFFEEGLKINNSIQIMNEGSGIEVQIFDTKGVPVPNSIFKIQHSKLCLNGLFFQILISSLR